jgi:phosphoribosylamine--glycine ligase
MGTFTDPSILSADNLDGIVETIVRPTLKGCVKEGFPFLGILFVGLMMTTAGPKVLEYNIRFGDPETQAILVRLETELIDICEAMLNGRLSDLEIKWRRGSSACVVLASEGYPGKAKAGVPITGLQCLDVEIFHAGTKKDEAGNVITAGGRVLGVTAVGDNLKSALASAYGAIEKINWPGMQYRRDIGKTSSSGTSTP